MKDGAINESRSYKFIFMIKGEGKGLVAAFFVSSNIVECCPMYFVRKILHELIMLIDFNGMSICPMLFEASSVGNYIHCIFTMIRLLLLSPQSVWTDSQVLDDLVAFYPQLFDMRK